jgi:formiminotetrahydrofolate cyclodeaminase
MRLPKKTDAEKRTRDEAIAKATRLATEVPLETLLLANDAAELADTVARKGSPGALSDAAVAAAQAGAAAEGAWMNVVINLGRIADRDFARSARQRSDAAIDRVRKTTIRTLRAARRKLTP